MNVYISLKVVFTIFFVSAEFLEHHFIWKEKKFSVTKKLIYFFRKALPALHVVLDVSEIKELRYLYVKDWIVHLTISNPVKPKQNVIIVLQSSYLLKS